MVHILSCIHLGLWFLSQRDLHSMLFDTMPTTVNVKQGVVKNCSLHRLSDHASEVHVTFEDESTEKCDLLIGADGAHSVIRKLVRMLYFFFPDMLE